MSKTRVRAKSRGKTRRKRGGAASGGGSASGGGAASAAKETESEMRMREKEESRIRMIEQEERAKERWKEIKSELESKGIENPNREEYFKGTYNLKKTKEVVALNPEPVAAPGTRFTPPGVRSAADKYNLGRSRG